MLVLLSLIVLIANHQMFAPYISVLLMQVQMKMKNSSRRFAFLHAVESLQGKG